jgi:hypothetical protein
LVGSGSHICEELVEAISHRLFIFNPFSLHFEPGACNGTFVIALIEDTFNKIKGFPDIIFMLSKLLIVMVLLLFSYQ